MLAQMDIMMEVKLIVLSVNHHVLYVLELTNVLNATTQLKDQEHSVNAHQDTKTELTVKVVN